MKIAQYLRVTLTTDNIQWKQNVEGQEKTNTNIPLFLYSKEKCGIIATIIPRKLWQELL